MLENIIETYKVSVFIMFVFYTIHTFTNMDKKINHGAIWFCMFTPIINTCVVLSSLLKILLSMADEVDRERKHRRRK